MKIKIDILSKATSAPAQGVGSVYLEQTKLLEDFGKEDFELSYNKHTNKADLYHIHSINPIFYLMMKKKRTTICFVHFLPNTLEGSIKLPKFMFSIFKKYVVSFYKKAKEIVVVNPSFIKDLTEYGLDEKRITYIPNFVSEKNFYKLEDTEKIELRRKYSIPENAFTVLSVGQVQTRKGVLDFLKLSEENPDMYFIWAGGFSFKGITDGYKELKAEMEKKRDNVKFLGIVDREKMNEVYNLADVFLLPSYNELFPMALLENCSVTNPYIVRDLSLYDDILLGDYLRAKDNDEFSFILRRLRTDKEFYNDGVEISKLMKEKYSRSAVYQMWKEYYQNIYLKYKK